VLDNVAVGPLAKNPARKDAAPFIIALILHRQLDEGARLGRIFPRRGLLARAQPYDRAANPRRVAGLHFDVADQPVALVEQADDGDAVGHRGRPLDTADFGRHAFGFRDLRRLAAAATIGRGGPVAGGERGGGHRRQPQHRGQPRHGSAHSAPGRQAS
jgi:hypothetical protein